MENVIQFPKEKRNPLEKSKRRVFCIGYRYLNPVLCDGLQYLYLKRHGLTEGGRWWSIIVYAKVFDTDKRVSSIPIETFKDEALLDKLEMYGALEHLSLEDLFYVGWEGGGQHSNNVLKMRYGCEA